MKLSRFESFLNENAGTEKEYVLVRFGTAPNRAVAVLVREIGGVAHYASLTGVYVNQFKSKMSYDEIVAKLNTLNIKFVLIDKATVVGAEAPVVAQAPASVAAPTTAPRTTPAVTASNVTVEELKRDLNSFRPGSSDTQPVDADENYASKDFRHLGNWIDDEGDEDEEDNDNRIWAPGEYKKYMKIFTDWAKAKPWFKKVDLSIETSEKDWVSFRIKIKS